MSWAAMIPVVLAGAALLLVPGGLVAFALGLRGTVAAAAATALTVTISAGSAILAGKLGVDWSVLPLMVAAVLVAALAWLAQRLIRHRSATTPQPRHDVNWRSGLWPVAGFAVGAGIILWQLGRVYGAPDNISQTFDGIFHLNAIQFVLTTADASSLTVSAMTNGDNPPYFYPAAWHGLAALLVQLTGVSVAVAANALNIIIASLIWPLGAMALVRTVAGDKPWVVGFGGVLAAGFSAFPLLLLDFGVLYPNFLSIALLPAGLSAVALFFRVGMQPLTAPVARYALAPLLAVGIAIAHPNGAMSLLALTVPVLLFAYARRYILSGHPATRRHEAAVTGALVVLALLVLAALWKVIRPPADAAFWQRYRSPVGGVWEVLTTSAMNRPVALVVSALVIVGLYSALRRRELWWIVGCYTVITALFVVIVGFPDSYLRNALTGVWYNDSYRLAAVLPLTAIPLAALGFDRLLRWGRPVLQRLLSRNAPAAGTTAALSRLEVGAAVLLAALLVAGMQSSPMNFAVTSAARNYVESPDAEVLSNDELALLEQLDDVVPEGARIAVNPWTGAALAFALADRDTTSRHVLSTYPRDIEIINNSLRNADTDPSVCAAVAATGVRYALDFGSKEVHGGKHDFPGLDNLQDSPAAELVAQVGEAKLFRITACQ